MFASPRVQGHDTWFGNGNMRIAPTWKPWSGWLFWHDDGAFDGYDVDLEGPHRRDDLNVYSSNRVLDVEVEPDRQCSRKDEHERHAAVSGPTRGGRCRICRPDVVGEAQPSLARMSLKVWEGRMTAVTFSMSGW